MLICNRMLCGTFSVDPELAPGPMGSTEWCAFKESHQPLRLCIPSEVADTVQDRPYTVSHHSPPSTLLQFIPHMSGEQETDGADIGLWGQQCSH